LGPSGRAIEERITMLKPLLHFFIPGWTKCARISTAICLLEVETNVAAFATIRLVGHRVTSITRSKAAIRQACRSTAEAGHSLREALSPAGQRASGWIPPPRLTGSRLLRSFVAAVVIVAPGVPAYGAGSPLPLREVALLPLPGPPIRFDYQSFDPTTHLLW